MLGSAKTSSSVSQSMSSHSTGSSTPSSPSSQSSSGDDCVRCDNGCCYSKSTTFTFSIPTITADLAADGGWAYSADDAAFFNIVIGALNGMSKSLNWGSVPANGPAWVKSSSTFTAPGNSTWADTYRIDIWFYCGGWQIVLMRTTDGGSTWSVVTVIAEPTTGADTSDCCSYTWNSIRFRFTMGGGPPSAFKFIGPITVTASGNTCCRDGSGNCQHGDGDCSGDCASSSSSGSAGDLCVVWKAHYNCTEAVWETEPAAISCDDALVAAADMNTWVRDGTTCDWYLKRLQSGGAPVPSHPASNESCCG